MCIGFLYIDKAKVNVKNISPMIVCPNVKLNIDVKYVRRQASEKLGLNI